MAGNVGVVSMVGDCRRRRWRGAGGLVLLLDFELLLEVLLLLLVELEVSVGDAVDDVANANWLEAKHIICQMIDVDFVNRGEEEVLEGRVYLLVEIVVALVDVVAADGAISLVSVGDGGDVGAGAGIGGRDMWWAVTFSDVLGVAYDEA